NQHTGSQPHRIHDQRVAFPLADGMAATGERQVLRMLAGVQVHGAHEIHVAVLQRDRFTGLDDLVDVLVVRPAEDDVGDVALDGRIVEGLFIALRGGDAGIGWLGTRTATTARTLRTTAWRTPAWRTTHTRRQATRWTTSPR